MVFKKDIQVIKYPKQRTIINNIQGKERSIQTIERSLIPDNAEIKRLNGTVSDLMNEVLLLKNRRDTAMLVETQDTLITVLYTQGQIKDTVINKQERIISDLKYISNSKDTLIAIKDAKIKKAIRQRNIFMITTGILTGIAIVK
jgi:hypothetical protein